VLTLRQPPLAPLRKQQHLDADNFVRLSACLHNLIWEPTNDTTERGGRTFCHAQHPHVRLRALKIVDADLKVQAYRQKEHACAPAPRRPAEYAPAPWAAPRASVIAPPSPRSHRGGVLVGERLVEQPHRRLGAGRAALAVQTPVGVAAEAAAIHAAVGP